VATVHNYRLLCAGGSFFREGRPCHDCLPSSHFPGVRHGCYRDSRLATAPVALANALHRRSWQGLDAVLVLSEAQRRLFRVAGFDAARVWVKPNFVPDVLTGPPLSTPGDTFVYAGRLAATKGVGVIMKAWAVLASRGIEPPLSIVGSGPLDDEVMRFAQMHRSVNVMGRVSPADCLEHIRRARAVLAPSTWEETFGLVVVEAMMLGRCAVATAIGSFPDLVCHGDDGLLVPPDDAEALADAVARLHHSEDMAQRLGAAARATYEQRFRPEPNLELLESIYDSVLRRAYV
jgi:glycosyltransferase involved in cell wall biosynthesis